MNTERAVIDFCLQNGYGADGGASKKWDIIKFGAIGIPIPNLESRRQNLYLHDINHILTGFDTTWKGESAVSSWEIAAGGWGKLIFPWLLTLGGMGIGVVFYPKSTYNAFQAGLKMKSSFTGGLSKTTMYALPVAELRHRLKRSTAEAAKRRYMVWATISLLVWFAPLIGAWLIYTLFR